MQSMVSVIITDANGIIEFVNPKYSELMGYSFTEAVGKTAEILKPDGRTKVLGIRFYLSD